MRAVDVLRNWKMWLILLGVSSLLSLFTPRDNHQYSITPQRSINPELEGDRLTRIKPHLVTLS